MNKGKMPWMSGNFADIKFRRKFLAMGVGNVMEWYDFAIFGALADVIGAELFPEDTASKQLLKGLAVFGAAFLMRPLGGVVMGRIGDTAGRKKALEVSIALMLLPSFLIGCLPSFKQWGIKTTIFLVILRLMQGLAVGGELVGAYIYTIEATGGKDRGFWGAMCKASGNLGTTLGMGVAALLRCYLTRDALHTWGWRLPFLSGILFGVVGIWLRSQLDDEEGIPSSPPKVIREREEVSNLLVTAESEAVLVNAPSISPLGRVIFWPGHRHVVPQSEAEETQNPLMQGGDSKKRGGDLSPAPDAESGSSAPTLDTIRKNWRELILVMLVSSFWGCSYYTSFVWMTYFMGSSALVGGNGVPSAWIINFLLNCVLVCLFPLGGALGDFLGKALGDEEKGFRIVMQLGTLFMMVVVVPAFGLISTRTVGGAVLGQGFLLIAVALFGSNLPAFMVSQFPIRSRYSGIGIAYNVAHAMFSGTAPIIQTALVLSSTYIASQSSGDQDVLKVRLSTHYLLHDGRLRPAYYIIAVSMVSFTALTFGAPYCERIRKQKEETRYTEAAIEAAFRDERMPSNFPDVTDIPAGRNASLEVYQRDPHLEERFSV